LAPTPRAVFYTDASVAIGGGHVRRCLVLADALAEAGWDITFVCGPDAAATVSALSRRPYALIEPRAFEVATHAPGFSCALVVVDDYRLDAVFESRCRSWAERIFVIDDLADRRHDCDVLLDQSPGRQRADYAGLVPSEAELLLGPSYALLDQRFRAVRRQRRPTAGRVARIFVNFGTTDTANATEIALDAIAQAKLGAAVDIVLGGSAPHLVAIRAQVATLGNGAALHLDVDDVASLMQSADLAIGAGGVGSLERCALGLPSLILTVADNQVAVAAGLAKANAAIYLGDIARHSAQDIARAIRNLGGDSVARQAMSVAATRLVDGLGAMRARVACYPPQRAKDGRRVTLHQAELADSAAMLAWQSAPGIRKYARNPATPRRQEHERWLRAKLDDPDCLFNVVQCGAEPVGILRFDKVPAGDGYEISILIAADRQGLGIGGCALALGKQFLPTERIIAAIHPENLASIRMFERAGYRPAGAGEWVLDPTVAALTN
jgi:UDP-2,4-diacetamido-2,4,6-trideoxy-beta-L-altropyranose hydrolase